ncbi:MAG: universal stress protein, partial [Syntrophobacteria bacterium]
VMTRRFLVGVDNSQNTLQALTNLGNLLLDTDVHFHLFHAVPESSLLYPGELSTLSGEPSDWEKVQRRQAEKVLDQAMGALVELGYKRSRLHPQSKLQSVSTAQDILEASENADSGAIVLARKGHSAVKRFLLGSTTASVCQYAEAQPVWAIGPPALRAPRILAALDESDYAIRVVTHLAETLGPVPGTRVNLLHVIPAKPPGYWDNGHILDEMERSEREALVRRWRSLHEDKMADVFSQARKSLMSAGIGDDRITSGTRPRVRGIARDIIAEANRGNYNILAFGRRGTSGIREFNLGSRASKILQSTPECTLIVVN